MATATTIGVVSSFVMPPADEIRRKSAEILSRPDYQIEERVRSETLQFWYELLLWLLTPFIWLFEALEGIPDALRLMIVIGLAVICVALIAHIVYTFISALRGPPAIRFQGFAREQSITPEDLEAVAEQQRQAGHLIEAIRFLFRAALLRIERAEQRPLRRGITNRELLRRYRTTALAEPLQHFVAVIDAKWYGREACFDSDYEGCRDEHARIRSVLERRSHVTGA